MSYIIAMLFGVIIGATIRSQKLLRMNTKLQILLVVLLLFTMGVTFGARTGLLQELQTTGVHSSVYAIFAGGMSALVVYLLSKRFLKERGK